MIEYITGDATQPTGDGDKIIAHICNDIGAWGRGFVLSLTNSWPASERSYRNWSQMNETSDGYPELVPFRLGRMKLVRVDNNVWIANMIAQHGIMVNHGVHPIRYDVLRDCLAELALHARSLEASVHMPRIGCGLAGGEWSKIEPIINEELDGINVFVYDFSSQDARTIPWKK